MLDFAWEPDPLRSRLTCQLRVSDALDGPGGADAAEADLTAARAATAARNRAARAPTITAGPAPGAHYKQIREGSSPDRCVGTLDMTLR